MNSVEPFEKRPLPSLTSALWVCARPATGTRVIDKTRTMATQTILLGIKTLEADGRSVFMVVEIRLGVPSGMACHFLRRLF